MCLHSLSLSLSIFLLCLSNSLETRDSYRNVLNWNKRCKRKRNSCQHSQNMITFYRMCHLFACTVIVVYLMNELTGLTQFSEVPSVISVAQCLGDGGIGKKLTGSPLLRSRFVLLACNTNTKTQTICWRERTHIHAQIFILKVIALKLFLLVRVYDWFIYISRAICFNECCVLLLVIVFNAEKQQHEHEWPLAIERPGWFILRWH